MFPSCTVTNRIRWRVLTDNLSLSRLLSSVQQYLGRSDAFIGSPGPPVLDTGAIVTLPPRAPCLTVGLLSALMAWTLTRRLEQLGRLDHLSGSCIHGVVAIWGLSSTPFRDFCQSVIQNPKKLSSPFPLSTSCKLS
jgi:hypothetical protein